MPYSLSYVEHNHNAKGPESNVYTAAPFANESIASQSLYYDPATNQILQAMGSKGELVEQTPALLADKFERWCPRDPLKAPYVSEDSILQQYYRYTPQCSVKIDGSRAQLSLHFSPVQDGTKKCQIRCGCRTEKDTWSQEKLWSAVCKLKANLGDMPAELQRTGCMLVFDGELHEPIDTAIAENYYKKPTNFPPTYYKQCTQLSYWSIKVKTAETQENGKLWELAHHLEVTDRAAYRKNGIVPHGDFIVQDKDVSKQGFQKQDNRDDLPTYIPLRSTLGRKPDQYRREHELRPFAVLKKPGGDAVMFACKDMMVTRTGGKFGAEYKNPKDTWAELRDKVADGWVRVPPRLCCRVSSSKKKMAELRANYAEANAFEDARYVTSEAVRQFVAKVASLLQGVQEVPQQKLTYRGHALRAVCRQVFPDPTTSDALRHPEGLIVSPYPIIENHAAYLPVKVKPLYKNRRVVLVAYKAVKTAAGGFLDSITVAIELTRKGETRFVLATTNSMSPKPKFAGLLDRLVQERVLLTLPNCTVKGYLRNPVNIEWLDGEVEVEDRLQPRNMKHKTTTGLAVDALVINGFVWGVYPNPMIALSGDPAEWMTTIVYTAARKYVYEKFRVDAAAGVTKDMVWTNTRPYMHSGVDQHNNPPVGVPTPNEDQINKFIVRVVRDAYVTACRTMLVHFLVKNHGLSPEVSDEVVGEHPAWMFESDYVAWAEETKAKVRVVLREQLLHAGKANVIAVPNVTYVVGRNAETKITNEYVSRNQCQVSVCACRDVLMWCLPAHLCTD
jgi:hypothetical protein